MSRIEDLKALLDGTPLAIERIMAIWPGLTVVDKATLMTLLMSSEGAINYSTHRDRFIDEALADDNAYIRYLAARNVYRPREGATLKEVERYSRVQNDSSMLVRSAETEYGSWKQLNFQPESFWGKPHAWRLAAVTGAKHGGEEFAKLLIYASDHLLAEGNLTEDEMVDVTLQYLTWETLERRLKGAEEYSVFWGDGWVEYCAGKSLDALWEIIPKLPRQVGFVMLRHLPAEGGLAGGVGGHILNSLDTHQQKVLLYRDDIRLDAWRREQFERSEDKDTRLAALANPRFRLDDSVISALVYQPGESQEEGIRKFDELQDLAMYYKGASMAQSSAIAKLIKNAPRAVTASRIFHDRHDHFAFQNCEWRVKTLDRHTLELEFRDLQLLEMVWSFVSMNGDISDRCPSVFRPHLIPENPWESYLRLREVERAARNYNKDGFELKRAIEENRPSYDFGLPIPSELFTDLSDQTEEGPQDALMRILPLKLNELRTNIDRTKTLLWALILGLGLLLIFRR